MTIRAALRALAYLLAAIGLLDPALQATRAQQARLSIVTVGGEPSAALESRRDVSRRLRESLAPQATATLIEGAPESGAAACPPDAACVVVAGDDAPAHVIGEGGHLLAAIRVAPERRDALALLDVRVGPEPSARTAGTTEMRVRASADGGPVRVRVTDDGMLVGERELAAPPEPTTPVEIPWWPLAEGPRLLRVEVEQGTDSSRQSVRRTVTADVRDVAREVLVYDPRPSWASTFVRRALDADPRFVVSALSRVTPALSSMSGPAPRLALAALARAAVVVVGSAEALSSAEVQLLERFARVRGGTVVLLPERALGTALARVVGVAARERLEREPLALGPLRASELLLFDQLPAAAEVVVSTPDGRPAVVALPLGEGRVIVSGALDAWRARGEDGGFEAFWRGLVVEAARASGRPVELAVTPPASAAGEGAVELTWRSLDVADGPVTAAASLACDGGPAEPIRLWPSGARRLRGRLPASATAQRCVVSASVDGPVTGEAQAAFATPEADATAPSTWEALARLAVTQGATVHPEGVDDGVVASLMSRLPATEALETIHPARSPWWWLPFTLALCAEWWLRRRQGLR